MSKIGPLHLAHASRLAYVDPPHLLTACAQYSFTSARQVSTRSLSVTFVEFGNARIIAFRGTARARNWIYNLMLVPVRQQWGRVHSGFAMALAALWPEVEHEVLSASGHGQKIYFTGHSLGGALAVIATLRTHFELNRSVEGLVTFGQPPLLCSTSLGNVDLAIRGRFLRFVSSVDIVVTGPFLPYFHAGALRYFDANNKLWEDMSWRRFFADALRLGWQERPAGQVTLHFMDNYETLVRKYAEREPVIDHDA